MQSKVIQIIDKHIKNYQDKGHKDTVMKFKKLKSEIVENIEITNTSYSQYINEGD